MIKINDKSKCSGCYACISICPKQAMSMKVDEEGFWYPQIDTGKCVECGLCEKVCQAIEPITIERKPLAYACNHKDVTIRMVSSSGGAFTAIASHIIGHGGIVFGAGFDENYMVQHISVETVEDLWKIRGSKYVQSMIGDTYICVKEELEKGRLVLFTGTPCQIDGLLHYLRKGYDNLYTQDIICHGVPSLKVWQKYLGFQQDRFKSQIAHDPQISFRNKKNGWEMYSQFLPFENGKEYCVYHRDDLFMKVFLQNLSLRPSCYNCHSKTLNRNSDITLADFWGIKQICPEMHDGKGTSLVILNTEKGNQLFKEVRCRLYVKEISLYEAVENNSSAYRSVPKPQKRKWFFKNLEKMEFDRLVEKATKVLLVQKIQRSIRFWFSFLRHVFLK